MILVTGATGRLGGSAVRILRQGRGEVRCLVRSGSDYFWLNETGASYFFGDLRESPSLMRAAKGCDHVLHAAGIDLESTDNHHETTTLEGTKNLVDASIANEVKHFVMVSCVAPTQGDNQSAALDATRKAEQYLVDSGLSYTILRCAPFLDDIANLVKRANQGDSATLWGSAEALVNPIWRQDAALYAVAALDHPSMRNRVVTLGGADTLTVKEAVSKVQRISGGNGEVEIPVGLPAKLKAKSIAMVLGRRWTNFIERSLALWGQDSATDTKALIAAIGLPLTDFDTAIEAALKHTHPSEEPNARDDRVVHRQFQATVYDPGEVAFEELPTGPRNY